MPKTILVVDNELRSRQLIAHLLREEGYKVDEADDGVSALEILEKKIFDLMICDVVMPRLNAFGVLGYMKSRSLSTSIILITGHPNLLADKGLGSLTCLMKPLTCMIYCIRSKKCWVNKRSETTFYVSRYNAVMTDLFTAFYCYNSTKTC